MSIDTLLVRIYLVGVWGSRLKSKARVAFRAMGFLVPPPKTKVVKSDVVLQPPNPMETQRNLLRRWPIQKLKAKLAYLEANSVP